MNNINRYLDHAVLKPELTRDEALEAIRQGVLYRVRTVFVRPCDIEAAVEICKNTETVVASVVGFPHGVVPTEIKVQEAVLYLQKGVKEIDMVVNYSFIKSAMWTEVSMDINKVVQAVKPYGVLLKVIFETAMLTIDEIEKTTELCVAAGADFVKTSTGFNGGGATAEAVSAMLRASKGRIKVKASGGIRDYKTARMFIEMGCERLGNSYTATPAICSMEETGIDDPGSY